MEHVKKLKMSRRDAEAQRFEIDNCFIFFAASAPPRLCARHACSCREFFTRSCPGFPVFLTNTLGTIGREVSACAVLRPPRFYCAESVGQKLQVCEPITLYPWLPRKVMISRISSLSASEKS